MAIFSSIKKEIKQYLKNYGFISKGNSFYKIINELAFCIGFEQPTGVLYCEYYIMPLYMPAENRYITYGNRFDAFEYSMLSPLSAYAHNEEIEVWIANFKNAFETTILPFYSSISDINAFYDFLNKDQRTVHSYFFCPQVDLILLKLYTASYIERYSDVLSLSLQIKNALNNTHYLSSRIIDKRLMEVERLLQVAHYSPDEKRVFFRDLISNTTKNCFK